MRVTVFCFLLLLSRNLVFSQSLLLTDLGTAATLAPNAMIIVTVAANTQVTDDIDVTNTSGSTKSYKAKKYNMQMNAVGNSTATSYYSFAGFNYAPNVIVSAAGVTLSAGQSASQQGQKYLNAALFEAQSVGFSQVKYTIFNVAAPADSVQITFNYNPPIGLEKKTLKDGTSARIFNEQLYICFTTANPYTAEIILRDIGGRIILKEQRLVSTTADFIFDLSRTPAGIYLLQISSENGLFTEKLFKE